MQEQLKELQQDKKGYPITQITIIKLFQKFYEVI